MSSYSEIQDAVKRVEEIKKLVTGNKSQNTGIRIQGSTNVHLENNIIEGFDVGIDVSNSQGITAFRNKITTSERADIIVRLDQIIPLLLDTNEENSSSKNKIKTLVESFKGSQAVIQTALLGSQFIAWIMANVH